MKTGDEISFIERFREIAGYPDLSRTLLRALVRIGCDEDRRNEFVIHCQPLVKLQAVHAWHLHVGNQTRNFIQTTRFQELIRAGKCDNRGVGLIFLLGAVGVALRFGQQYLENEHVGLVGTARDALIQSAVLNCKQRQGPMGDPTILMALCKCYSERLADTLSNNDVIAIGTLDPRVSMPMQPKIDAAAKFCGDRFRKTGHF